MAPRPRGIDHAVSTSGVEDAVPTTRAGTASSTRRRPVAAGREDSLPFVPFAPPVPREWVSFPDPDDPDHEIRADLSFLLSSWACIFGGGCQGIAGQPAQGCCSHGAFFSDAADERRVRNAAKELTTDDWARYGQRVLAQPPWAAPAST